PTEEKSLKPTNEPSTQLPKAPPPMVPATSTPLWSTVAKKGRKRNTTAPKEPPTVVKPTTTNPPAIRKGLTARERRLIIKREGAPLNTTALALRDDINQALSGTYVQTVTISENNLTITTIESILTTSLNSNISTFLHLI